MKRKASEIDNPEEVISYVIPPPISKNDLFDNPMINAAKASLSSEYQEKQRKLGEELFKMNFEKGMLENQDDIDDLMVQIKTMLKSGLHPSYLTTEEKHFLECKMGEEWYKHFGYLSTDLHRINL